MWLNLRIVLIKEPTQKSSQRRLSFFYLRFFLFLSRALRIAKTNDATVTIVETIAQRSVMLSYPVIAGLLVQMNSEVQPTTTVVHTVSIVYIIRIYKKNYYQIVFKNKKNQKRNNFLFCIFLNKIIYIRVYCLFKILRQF